MNNSNPEESLIIYNRIQVLRAERNLSRKELADKLSINVQTIGYIERGDYFPSLELAFRFARAFELPLEAVFSAQPFGHMSEEIYNKGDTNESHITK